MSARTIDDVIARAGALPPLPQTVYRLVGIVSDPAASLTAIVDAIRYDQAFTAEILRLCNSAYFGLAREVVSIDDAVKLLGTVKVLQLVIATHAKALLAQPQSGYGLPAGGLFLHSVAVALATQALARPLKLQQAGLAFTAGLLHDVGKVVLNEFVAEDYIEIARRVAQDHVAFSEAEEQVFGCSHAEVGARLAERWALPPGIVDCIRYHHAPLALERRDPYVDAVHIADAICILLGIGGGDDGLSYRACPTVMSRNGLTEADVEALGVEVVAEVKSVQAMLASR